MSKILIIEFGFFIVLFGIILRLFHVQIIRADHYRDLALAQYRTKIEIPPQRGNIYDKQGRILATSKRVEDFFVIKYLIEDCNEIDSVFCHYFEKPSGYYTKKIEENSGFIFLRRRVNLDVSNEIIALNMDGVGHQKSYKRVYPYGSCGAQIIGLCDIDNNGLEGLEKFYDDRLCGVSGESFIFRDARGNRNHLLSYGGVDPIAGDDIQISVDIEFQSIVEKELEEAVIENKAASGNSIFLEPKTGKVLAMASYPGYDPENPGQSSPVSRKNRTITDVFEPGSIFKFITFVAALEDSNFSIEDTIFCENGVFTNKWKVVEDTHEMGWSTLREIIVESSNIGIIKLAYMIENSLIFDRIQKFGFGTVTGIDFEGEVGGVLHPLESWTAYSDLSIPMGYEISVTPLQIVAAYGAIANGGNLMQPYLVTDFKRDGQYFEKKKSIRVRSVLEDETDSLLIHTLAEVVERGTAKKIKIDGISIAGKTGTAKKARLDGTGYWDDKYIGSFVGFAPVENPQVVGIVSIDTPQGLHYYGSAVAGPAFKGIIQRAVNIDIVDIQPDSSKIICSKKESISISTPDVRRMSLAQAQRILLDRGFDVSVIGSGARVVAQNPLPETIVATGSALSLVLDNPPDLSEKSLAIPDIVGLSMRDAISELSEAGIKFTIIGSGSVVATVPKAEEFVSFGETIVMECRNAHQLECR